MTVIIDKNSDLYKNFIEVKNVLRNQSQAERDKIKEILDRDVAKSFFGGNEYDPSFVLGTIEGVELQVEGFEFSTGLVFYAVLAENGKVTIKKAVLPAKFVEDD